MPTGPSTAPSLCHTALRFSLLRRLSLLGMGATVAKKEKWTGASRRHRLDKGTCKTGGVQGEREPQ